MGAGPNRQISPRALQVAAVISVLFIAAVIYAANVGIDHPGYVLVRRLPYGDKIGHVGLFGGLTFVINLALGCRRFPLFGRKALLGTTVVGVLVLAEELSQGLISRRSLDIVDLTADVVGLTLGSLAALWVNSRLRPEPAVDYRAARSSS